MIIPIGHERMEAQRLPYVTITIIALNVIFFIGTLISGPKHREELYTYSIEMEQYYMEHPYLEFPPDTLEKFPKEVQEAIKDWQELISESTEGGDYGRTDLMVYAMDVMREQGENQLSEEELAAIREEEQQHFNYLAERFNWAYKRDVYFRYGYIPSRGGIFTMFSSMFMHGGFLHIIFNMWFLWLSGCNIEDVWGRVVYPIFYVLGGIFAVLAHAIMSPESTVPLIGASGAIAAVMGAFMVRMYNIKINFIYWFGLLFRGKFSAPAYVMLPLWLLQQLWEAFMSGEGSGVAFWAHIGGFVFGAVVAAGIQFGGIEKKYLTPAIDRKVAVLDEHLAAGMTKLQEGNVQGAIKDLREAAQNDPGNPMIYSELSRAYFKKGDIQLGMRDLKRAVNGFMKRGDMDEAIMSYLEVSAEHTDVMLDPPQQLKMAAALKNRADVNWHPPQVYDDDDGDRPQEPLDLYTHAAFAYKQAIQQYQRLKKLQEPQGTEALIQYADICLQHLSRPQDAAQAYQFALKSEDLEGEQKKALQNKLQQCKYAIADQAQSGQDAKARKRAAAEVRARWAKEQQQQSQPTQAPPPLPSVRGENAAPSSQKPQQPTSETSVPIAGLRTGPTPSQVPTTPKPKIPLRQRIKVIQPSNDPAKYLVRSAAPRRCGKITPVPGGLDVRILQEPPLLFEQIYFICVSQVPDPEFKEGLMADIFVVGQSRPYRISSEHVQYSRFLRTPPATSFERFRQFLLYLISQVDSVYMDQETITFLEKGKVRKASEEKALELYEKHIWQQLMGSVRTQCGNCWKIYWIDGARIPTGGAQTTCRQCGKPMTVRPLPVQPESA